MFPTDRNTLKTTYGALNLPNLYQKWFKRLFIVCRNHESSPFQPLVFPLQHFRLINLVRSALILH